MYLLEEFGVRLEDIIVLADTGARIVSALSRAVAVV